MPLRPENSFGLEWRDQLRREGHRAFKAWPGSRSLCAFEACRLRGDGCEGSVQEIDAGAGAMGILRDHPAPGAAARFAMKQPQHVPGHSRQPRSPGELGCNIGFHASNDLGTRLNAWRAAENATVDIGEDPWRMIGGAPQHHAIDMSEMDLRLDQRGDAAIDHDLKPGICTLEAIDALMVERRDLTVLLGREALEPSLAGVNDEGLAPRIGHKANEAIEILIFILVVDANTAFDRDRNGDRGAHRGHAFGDEVGLGHQAGTETAL